MQADKHFDAVREGAKEAILEAMRGITDMPGTDTFQFIKEGVKEATLQWLNDNKTEIIETMSQSK